MGGGAARPAAASRLVLPRRLQRMLSVSQQRARVFSRGYLQPQPRLRPRARAQVVLASGLGEEGVADWRRKSGAHLHQLLKFLTVRTEADKKDGRVERSGITALGGPHDPALDGAIAHASKCAAGSRSLLLRFCWL